MPSVWRRPSGAAAAVLGLVVDIGLSASALPAHGTQAAPLTVAYGLAYSVSTDSEALALAERLLDDPATPERWRQSRDRLLAEEQDLTAWMIAEIERLGPGTGPAL